MKKLLREYDTGWMTGPSLGMTPDSSGLRGSGANQKNFQTQSNGLEWPYENDDEMHYGQPVGPKGIDRGTPMGSNVTGRPPTPKLQHTWEGGPDEEMDEAMGVPFNSDMGGRGGAGKASPRGWAGSPLEFFVNGEQGDNDVPEEDPAEFPPTNQFSLKLKEEEDESAEQEEQPEEEESSDSDDVSDPGPFGGFEGGEEEKKEEEGGEEEEEDAGFGDDESAEEYDDSTDSYPGEENGPAGDDEKPVDINGMGIELGQMFGEEGEGDPKGEETGEEPPPQLGPVNPYPPDAEAPAGSQLHGPIDQSDEELDSLIGGGFGDGPDVAIGLGVGGPEEGPGGSVSNPIDLFTRPSPWDNIELVLRGSKNGQGPTPPGKTGQPVAEGNWKKWLGAAGAAAGLAMGTPAFGADPKYPEPTFQKQDVELPGADDPDYQLPNIYRGENDPAKLGIDLKGTAGREVNFDNVDDEDLFASAKNSQK